MITYRTDNERTFLFHYAMALKDEEVLSILERGEVTTSEEALHLSSFFWNAVDKSILDRKNNEKLPWDESSELLSERVMYVISGYLERAGFEQEWESVSDSQEQ